MNNFPTTFEFTHTHSLQVNIFACECKITPSPDSQTHVYAKGCPKFLQALEVRHHGQQGLLEIGYKTDANDKKPVFENGEHDNTLIIELPCGDKGQHMTLGIDGSGAIESQMPLFNTGDLSINGSGFIAVQNFAGTCGAVINTSGVINGKNAAQLKVSINCSGMCAWEDVQQARVAIESSGVVSLASVQKLNTAVSGSGVVSIGETEDDDEEDDFDE